MIDGQGLMVALDVLGKQLAQSEYEKAQLAAENTQLHEQLQAQAEDKTDAG